MKKKNTLLLFMIMFYVIPIFYVYYMYNDNDSVSNIICDEKCKNIILFFMILMGITTILYETKRDDMISFLSIDVLIISIIGLICVNETINDHYIFAAISFASILCFMVRNYYLRKNNNILLISIIIQILLSLSIVINMNDPIFYKEIFYILNFAFFYIFCHFKK